ncbi:MAG: hypothetical protein IPM90_15760 [Austwickia sp.]|nr:hypothetical protein [Austwickia sp.]
MPGYRAGGVSRILGILLVLAVFVASAAWMSRVFAAKPVKAVRTWAEPVPSITLTPAEQAAARGDAGASGSRRPTHVSRSIQPKRGRRRGDVHPGHRGICPADGRAQFIAVSDGHFTADVPAPVRGKRALPGPFGVASRSTTGTPLTWAW